MKLILATRNPGKLREIRALLADLPLVVMALPDHAPEVEETAGSFAGNAELKARAIAAWYRETTPPGSEAGPWVLADDSGLEVDALNGAPGVYSARYAGPGASDAANLAKLLEDLRDVPDTKRAARFRCAIALLAPDGRFWSVDGVCEGRIIHSPRGENGFGYDPVFLLPEHGQTTAELSPEEKNRISHRGQALRKAAALLREALQDQTG